MATSYFHPVTANDHTMGTKYGDTGSIMIFNGNDVSRVYDGSYLTQGNPVGIPSIPDTFPSSSEITLGLIPWDSNTDYLDNYYQEAFTGVVRVITGSATEYTSGSFTTNYGFSGGSTDGLRFPAGIGTEATTAANRVNTVMFWGKFPDLDNNGGAQDIVYEVRDTGTSSNLVWFRLKTIAGGLRFQALNNDGSERFGGDIQPTTTGSWACYLIEIKDNRTSILDKPYNEGDSDDFNLIKDFNGSGLDVTWGVGRTDTVQMGYGGAYNGGSSLYTDARLGVTAHWSDGDETANTTKAFRDEIFNVTKGYYQN